MLRVHSQNQENHSTYMGHLAVLSQIVCMFLEQSDFQEIQVCILEKRRKKYFRISKTPKLPHLYIDISGFTSFCF